MNTGPQNHAGILRQQLLFSAENYVASAGLQPHVYRSLGKVPVVLFRSFESEGELGHGNFHDETFDEITARPLWAKRLQKPHSGKARCFLPADALNAREMDSCTSSDALAMNIFCHPSSRTNAQLARLFGYGQLTEPDFGFKAHLPLAAGGSEPRSTEIDLRFNSGSRTVLAECKLAEADFTFRPQSYVQRYEALEETYDVARLPRVKRKVKGQEEHVFLHYQLIRNVLAARHHNACFYLLCDERRPDLQEAFEEVVSVINDPQLRAKCSMVTWQAIAATLPVTLRTFLAVKYGII